MEKSRVEIIENILIRQFDIITIQKANLIANEILDVLDKFANASNPPHAEAQAKRGGA